MVIFNNSSLENQKAPYKTFELPVQLPVHLPAAQSDGNHMNWLWESIVTSTANKKPSIVVGRTQGDKFLQSNIFASKYTIGFLYGYLIL